MQLRYYQQEAIHSLRNALIDGVKNPLVCLPTGSGKSPTICTFLHDLAVRFPQEKLVVAVHTKELVQQLADTYEAISGVKPAIYSASLKKKQIAQVTFSQIQSIYKHATKFGAIKLLAIDEADRCPVDGDGQYKTFIKEAKIINPDIRICGFTATPYRMGTGLVFGDGQPFDSMVYDIGIKQLIDDGFLSPLVSKDGGQPNLTGVAIRQGEFVSAQLETVMTDEALVEHSCDEIIRYGADRNGWLIFASGLKHAAMIREKMRERGIDCPIIEGTMDQKERDSYIIAFKNKSIKCLININVLSIGFNAPHVDLLALMRPTLSAGLYYQQVGRGLRIAAGKTNALVLDMAGNISRHGPIDTLNERIKVKTKKEAKGDAPTKTCEQCKEIVPAGVRKCPACGTEFPPIPIAKHAPVASLESAVSDSEIKTLIVDRWTIKPHIPKDPSKKPSLCVTYWSGLNRVSEWLSVDKDSHPFARQKALAWFRENPTIKRNNYRLRVEGNKLIGTSLSGDVVLDTAIGCIPWLDTCLSKPTSIRYQTDPQGGKYPRVLSRHYEPNSVS
jgi:DNA repair protein RadD